MNLEQLLRMKVSGISAVSGEDIEYSPEFRVSVQRESEDGVHVIIHADGYDSETLDLLVSENRIRVLYQKT